MSNNNGENKGNGTVFPFDLIKLPDSVPASKTTAGKVAFITKVEEALKGDLQDERAFGCRITDCHTHAGSKIHFESFVEAELLFHNNYYNMRFANMACNFIRNSIEVQQKSGNLPNKEVSVVLVGYDLYSELFLACLQDDLSACGITSDYCVYETSLDSVEPNSANKLRGLKQVSLIEKKIKIIKGDETFEYDINKTLIVYIVPINTSLSTMDKMIAQFYEIVEGEVSKETFKEDYICLITLNNDGGYEDKFSRQVFFASEENDEYLVPVEGKFEYLSDKTRIRNFVLEKTTAYLANKCKRCFPDRMDGRLASSIEKEKLLIEESPIFGVNRSSVVPMLKLGKKAPLRPIDSKSNPFENLKRVWELSEFTKYRHLERDENHFQFYFETEKFLEKHEKDVKAWLESLRGEFSCDGADDDGSVQIFDYLISPRHRTNPKFVHLVNKCVFGSSARIMFFDVNKEYRSNLIAKYSDFTAAIKNIQSSGLKYKIRFHFVDDIINLGTAFINAKNLVSSLTKDVPKDRIELFYSAILFVNRISPNRREFYISEKNCHDNTGKGFNYYVNVNISPMRNHKDACTLCKLTIDYRKILKDCATNTLADICSDVIADHMPKAFDLHDSGAVGRGNDTYCGILEKRFLFFISHLVSERLYNRFYLAIDNEPKYSIDIESKVNRESDISKVISAYFVFNEISEKLEFLKEEPKYEEYGGLSLKSIWETAFIKAISRPFFIYHLRSCQAIFSFCLQQLGAVLDKDKNRENLILVQTLVKALADMNANYIVRQSVLEKLFEWANAGYAAAEDIKCAYIKKRIFTRDSLVHYLKKNLVLSRDTTKSLLLEHWLLENSESGFFKDDSNVGGNADGGATTADNSAVKFIEGDKISLKGRIYFENNIILRGTLNTPDLDKIILSNDGDRQLDLGYEGKSNGYLFFENFAKVWRLNTGKTLTESNDIYKQFRIIKQKLKNFNDDRQDFSKSINELLEKLGCDEMRTLAFLHDKKVSDRDSELFEFFTVAGRPFDKGYSKLPQDGYKKGYGDLLVSQAFFHDDNIGKIRNYIKEYKEADLFFIDDVLHNDYKNGDGEQPRTLVVRFSADKGIEKQKPGDNQGDNSIYFQIWGFKKDKIRHWFAIKLLLTLRNDFNNLIESINLQELIEDRKVQMQKEALSIVKASTHSDGDAYYAWQPDHKNERKSFPEAHKLYSDEDAIYSYDRHLQILADEQISSIYRKIIKGEVCFMRDTFGDISNWHMVRSFFKTAGDDGICEIHDDNTFVYSLRRIEQSRVQKQKIKFCNKNSSWVLKWATTNGGDFAVIWLTLLLALNCRKYAKGKELTIEFDGSSIEFSNDIIGTEEQEDLDKKLLIPPWVYEDGQHITLWTLKHARGVSQSNGTFDKSEKYVSFGAEIIDNKFVVKIKKEGK